MAHKTEHRRWKEKASYPEIMDQLIVMCDAAIEDAFFREFVFWYRWPSWND